MKRGVRSVSARKLILFGCVLGVGVAALALTSCALFNKPPVAGFTIGPSTTGAAPFTVTLSGAASTDPEGEIATYAWDFGDGTTGSGKSVAHTYSVAGTFTIILTVTDNFDATDQAAKTIYVTAAAAAGPTASFTMSASSGTSPVSITFDASGTTYPGGTITAYEWTFGDGGNGFGQVTSHTYFSSASHTYTVTLLVRASDGKTGTASKTVSVSPTGGGGTPVAERAERGVRHPDRQPRRRAAAGGLRPVGFRGRERPHADPLHVVVRRQRRDVERQRVDPDPRLHDRHLERDVQRHAPRPRQRRSERLDHEDGEGLQPPAGRRVRDREPSRRARTVGRHRLRERGCSYRRGSGRWHDLAGRRRRHTGTSR